MRIAVIHHISATENDYGFYISDLLSEYGAWLGYDVQLLEDFLFYANKNKSLPENAVVGIHVKAESALRIRWWYSAKLPAILAQIKADAVVNLNGIYSKQTKVPQVLALGDISFLQMAKQANAPWKKLVAKNINAYIHSAENTFTYSQYAVNEIKKIAGTQNQTALVPYCAAKDYRVWEWHDKVMTKSEFTGGKDYFICVLDDEDVELWLTVLKAFSKFKKWQQSTMQLILLPKHDIVPLKIHDKITTYKYRDDVQMLEGLTEKEKANLFGSAYAVIHVPVNDADIMPAVEALVCGIPSITTGTSESLKEYGEGAGITVSSVDADLLGDAIIRVFKNEEEKETMANIAKNKAEEINWDNIAKTCWELIEKAAGITPKQDETAATAEN